MFAILYMLLPITTTVAGEWLISLIFHDDIKCITANGWTSIYVGANYMSHDDHSFDRKTLSHS